MWFVNRDPQFAAIIPPAVIRIDDLVKAKDGQQKLAKIFVRLLKDGVGADGQGRPESEQELISQFREWKPEELADWIWRLLKREPEEVIRKYIPETVGPAPSAN